MTAGGPTLVGKRSLIRRTITVRMPQPEKNQARRLTSGLVIMPIKSGRHRDVSLLKRMNNDMESNRVKLLSLCGGMTLTSPRVLLKLTHYIDAAVSGRVWLIRRCKCLLQTLPRKRRMWRFAWTHKTKSQINDPIFASTLYYRSSLYGATVLTAFTWKNRWLLKETFHINNLMILQSDFIIITRVYYQLLFKTNKYELIDMIVPVFRGSSNHHPIMNG